MEQKLTREQVVQWAAECGDWNGQTAEMNDVGLLRFAALAYSAGQGTEREACAEEAESAASDDNKYDIAASIRARGEK